MPPLLVTAAVLASCSGHGAESPDAARSGPARLAADAPRHDFGLLWEGVEVAHTFRLRVAGEGSLAIAGLKPGCGCTVAELAVLGPAGARPLEFGEPLAAGTELELSARLDTRGRSGSVPREIAIYDSSPDGRAALELCAEIRALLVVEPPRIELGRFRAELGARGAATVVAPGGERYVLTAADAPPGTTCELAPVEADAAGRAHTWRVEAGFAPGGAPGPRVAAIELATDVPLADSRRGFHSATVVLWGMALGALDVQPAELAFGLLRPGDVSARSAVVAASDPAVQLAELGELRATVLGPPPGGGGAGDAQPSFAWPGAAVHVRSADGGARQIELALVVPSGAAPGAFAGRVRLELDGVEGFPLEIPFSGAVTLPDRR